MKKNGPFIGYQSNLIKNMADRIKKGGEIRQESPNGFHLTPDMMQLSEIIRR